MQQVAGSKSKLVVSVLYPYQFWGQTTKEMEPKVSLFLPYRDSTGLIMRIFVESCRQTRPIRNVT